MAFFLLSGKYFKQGECEVGKPSRLYHSNTAAYAPEDARKPLRPKRGWSVAAASVIEAGQSSHTSYAVQPKNMCRPGFDIAQPQRSGFAQPTACVEAQFSYS